MCNPVFKWILDVLESPFKNKIKKQKKISEHFSELLVSEMSLSMETKEEIHNGKKLHIWQNINDISQQYYKLHWKANDKIGKKYFMA